MTWSRGRDVDDRLLGEERESVCFQGCGDALRPGDSTLRVCLAVRVGAEHRDPVAPVFLGVVEREVGVDQHVFAAESLGVLKEAMPMLAVILRGVPATALVVLSGDESESLVTICFTARRPGSRPAAAAAASIWWRPPLRRRRRSGVEGRSAVPRGWPVRSRAAGRAPRPAGAPGPLPRPPRRTPPPALPRPPCPRCP